MQSFASSSSRFVAMICSVVDASTLKLCRLRLLTPITFAPARSAVLVSVSLFTSTRGSIPSPRAHRIKADSSASSSTATMSRTVSAP